MTYISGTTGTRKVEGAEPDKGVRIDLGGEDANLDRWRRQCGRALGGGWTRSGHKVTYAVRDPSKPDLEELRRQGASIISSSGAAAAADVVALTVPWPAVGSSLKALGTLAGKIVIDATNPLTPDFSLAVGHTDSAGETVARLAPPPP